MRFRQCSCIDVARKPLWVFGATLCQPRQPHQSTLWKRLDTHYEVFDQDYEQNFRKDYGCRRAVVNDVVRDYLKCGDLCEGFARARCPDCCHEYLPSFSCKGRWFCPNCHARKLSGGPP